MNWSKLRAWLFGHGKKMPSRRTPSTARLAIETLEDRLVPSTTTTDIAYQLWRQQTFRVDDVQVASTPQNASFGSMIGMPSVFTNTPYRGQGYSVAVIDTGIDYKNAALGGGFGAGYRVVAGWDFVNNDADPMDDNGHGTHVAGIIGSSDATYSGVAPNVNLIALKVLSASGSGSFGNVQSALDWVVANRAKYNIVAINLSLGSGNYTSNPYTYLTSSFSTLKSQGVFISVAAGNSFYSYGSAPGLDYPAIDPQVVSVGAVYDGNFGTVAWGSGARDNTTAADRVASFSQRSSSLTIIAPGAMITSTYLGNTFRAMAGTSMAAPVVAGASVLIHQAMDTLHLTANQDTIISLMKKTGVNVVDGDDEDDNVTNTGLLFKRIDLGAAISSLGKPANSAPVLQPVANRQVAPGGSFTVSLSASDIDGDAITYSASVLSSSASQAYQLKQQLGLTYAGAYYTNTWGQNEKWMSSTSGTWYCILPNGQLRKWTGSMTTTLQAANLIATLDARFYADPSLLWNAQPASSAVPTLSLVGNQLKVTAPSGVTGSYQIQVSASDGKLSSNQVFTVTIQQNTAPQLAALAGQSMLANRSLRVTLSATDAQNDPITYSARIVGAYATTPASVVVNGNQLTIYSSPDYVGAFDVQITASDGALSSSTNLRVNVASSPVAYRLGGDFNGDAIQDTAFFNTDGSVWVSLKQGDGAFVNQSWTKWGVAADWNRILVGDFNGDRKADIIGFNNGGNIWVGTSNGSAFNTTLWGQWAPAVNWSLFEVGDFNGDGKTDMLAFSISGNVWIGNSTGAAFTPKLAFAWAPATNWSSLGVADLNKDGRPDLFGLSKTDNKWYVAYSSGAGAFSTQVWSAATPPK